MRKLLICTLVAFTFLALNGQDLTKYGIESPTPPTGLNIGDKVPAFTAKTSTGEAFQIGDALQHNAVAVIFYRGYWCGYCTRALAAFSDSLSYLNDMGIDVIAVTPETYENVDQTIEKAGVNFTIISDVNGDVMRAFDVEFDVTDAYNQKIVKYQDKTLEDINGQSDAALPIPATYLVIPSDNGKGGKVAWRHFDPDYSKRTSVRDIQNAYSELQ